MKRAAQIIRADDPGYSSDLDIIDAIEKIPNPVCETSDEDSGDIVGGTKKGAKKPMKQGGRGKSAKTQKTEHALRVVKKALASTPTRPAVSLVTPILLCYYLENFNSVDRRMATPAETNRYQSI